MQDKDNILISLDSCHARNIYAGTKRVELRRRIMHITPGTIVWIYEKIPTGCITGHATVTAVHIDSPKKLWGNFGSISGLSKVEFFTYFEDVDIACALVLDEIQGLHRPLSLKSLRKAVNHFQPPQFFIRLRDSHPVLSALNSSQRKRVSLKLDDQQQMSDAK